MSFTPNRLLLGLSAGSVLAGLWCGREIDRCIQFLGEASEETFRGDRLPFLDSDERERRSGPPSDAPDVPRED